MHQLTGMAAQQSFDAMITVHFKTRHHNALRQIVSVGQLHHPVQMPFEFRQKILIQEVFIELVSGNRRQLPCGSGVAIPRHADREAIQLDFLMINHTQNRSGVQAP